jgi:hypothetical protein
MAMNEVHVFRTSVEKKQEIIQLRPLLNQVVRNKGHWNFDLEDCDHILRVETRVLPPRDIASILQGEGFLCEEL